MAVITMARQAIDCDECIDRYWESHDELSENQVLEALKDEKCTCNRYIACAHCGKPAEFETGTLGIYTCSDNECIVELATREWLAEEISNDQHEEYGEPHLSEGEN